MLQTADKLHPKPKHETLLRQDCTFVMLYWPRKSHRRDEQFIISSRVITARLRYLHVIKVWNLLVAQQLKWWPARGLGVRASASVLVDREFDSWPGRTKTLQIVFLPGARCAERAAGKHPEHKKQTEPNETRHCQSWRYKITVVINCRQQTLYK